MKTTYVTRSSLLMLGLGLAGCAAKPSSEWSPQASASLKADFEGMFRDIDAAKFEAILAKTDPKAISFDFDEKNNPVRLEGADQIKKYFSGFEQMTKSQGLKIKSNPVRTDCYATDVVGYCAGEFDQTMTMGDQVMGPFKFRGTLVARKVKDAWQWTHWHGSFRESPPMPADAQAQAGAQGQAPQGAPPVEGNAAPSGEAAK